MRVDEDELQPLMEEHRASFIKERLALRHRIDALPDRGRQRQLDALNGHMIDVDLDAVNLVDLSMEPALLAVMVRQYALVDYVHTHPELSARAIIVDRDAHAKRVGITAVHFDIWNAVCQMLEDDEIRE